jgi:hypothetical protein
MSLDVKLVDLKVQVRSTLQRKFESEAIEGSVGVWVRNRGILAV